MLAARDCHERAHGARAESHVRRLDFSGNAEAMTSVIVDADHVTTEAQLCEQRTCTLDRRGVREKDRGGVKRAHSRRLRNADAATRIVLERVQAPVCPGRQ